MPTKATIEQDASAIDSPRQRAEATPHVYLSLSQAVATLPPGRRGRPVHIATLVRWITSGSRGPGGETVRLQAIRLGSRWATTREWFDDYARALTPSFGEADHRPRTTAARSRSAERAGRELDRIGI